MIEDIDRIRPEDLVANIEQDIKHLNANEEELRFESEPRFTEKYRREIEQQHESLKKYRQEFDGLQRRVTPAQVQNINDLLQQHEKKLEEVKKLLPPIWNVPRIRNPAFTGRTQILNELRSALISGEPAAWKQAVTGMGGVGKTQIALEYLYRHMAEYQIIWWIRAEESATLAADYASLAEPLDLPEKDSVDQTAIVRAVKSWLEHNTGWLLIFDNAQDTKDIGDHLPRAGGGHVIITLRNPVWSRIERQMPVKVFERTESIDFLIRRTGQGNREAADMLAEELGDLPLALEQAGAYIADTHMALASYCELFKSRRQELWEKDSPPVGYPIAVGATWSLSMDRVGEKSPEAADLLNLCAYLAPDTIPSALLREGKEYLPDPLAAAVADRLIWNQAVRGLGSYSLMEVKEENLSVHRLVQAFVRHHLEVDKEEKWIKAAIRILRGVFPSGNIDVNSWPLCNRLLPHVQVAAAHAEVAKVIPEGTSLILNQTGLYLQDRAEFINAKYNFERALSIGECAYGPDHPAVATIVNNLGLVLQDLGDMEGARKNIERALSISESAYGPDHPAVAIRLNNLGGVLQDLGDLEGARKNFECALSIDECAYGPDHPAVAIRVNNLGGVLRDLGDLEGARKNFERALSMSECAYGPDHPAVAIRVNNLGLVLQELGDLEGARENYERALFIDECVYGPDHPDVAIDVNNLGSVLRELGDLEGAQKNFERALSIDECAYGPDHPAVARDVNNLGGVLRDLGDLEGARKNFERAQSIDECAYGPDHPAVATIVNNLGLVLRPLGNLEGARKNFERALSIDECAYGPDHPAVATIVNNLGLVLRAMGDLESARENFERALAISESAYGPDHPAVATIVNNLGLVLRPLGNLEGAKENHERALAIFRKFLGDDHPNTTMVRNNLEYLELES